MTTGLAAGPKSSPSLSLHNLKHDILSTRSTHIRRETLLTHDSYKSFYLPYESFQIRNLPYLDPIDGCPKCIGPSPSRHNYFADDQECAGHNMTSKAVVITAQNRGPWINIVIWVLGFIVCLAAFIKLLSKRRKPHTLHYDDAYLVAATVCSNWSIPSCPEVNELTTDAACGDWLRHHRLYTSQGWSRATLIPSEQ